MRNASILLAIVAILSLTKGIAAQDVDVSMPIIVPPPALTHDYTLHIATEHFGFKQWDEEGPPHCYLYVGPCGSCRLPLTANQALIGSMVTLMLLVAAVAMAGVRRRRARQTA